MQLSLSLETAVRKGLMSVCWHVGGFDSILIIEICSLPPPQMFLIGEVSGCFTLADFSLLQCAL